MRRDLELGIPTRSPKGGAKLITHIASLLSDN
jgi:hypothetical protein